MILVYDTDDKPILLNPEYLIGAHQVGDNKTEVNLVGDIVYTVQGTPEDIHDAWTGVEEIEVEYGEDDPNDCSTCDYAEDGEAVPGQLICQMCVDYDLWEPADEDGHGEENGGGAGQDEEGMARVSGVPYAVPITRKGAGGVHD